MVKAVVSRGHNMSETLVQVSWYKCPDSFQDTGSMLTIESNFTE